MSEKYDDDDLDFDDDFGDFDMDPFSEPPIPKGRSPITHSLLKTGKKFTESFTDDKLETARKYVDASIPYEISSETYDIKRILSGAQEGYREAINEVRNEAKPFFNAMDNVIPKGGKLETLVNFAREKMGLNDTEKNYEQIAEDSANKAAAAVGEILGEQRTKEEYHNLVRDNIRTKRELSGLEIAATTASNLEFINRFNQEVVSKYQRKSLELQYRHLYTADEQLSVTKTAFDGFKNQLESIVINSALPELVKMKNSEFVQAKLYDKLTDGLFSKEGAVGAIRNKFMQEIKGIGNVIAGGMQAATSGLETYDNMKETSKLAGGTEGILASILADGLINVIGRKTGDIIAKTKPGNRLVNYVRNVMIDPSEQFRKDAEGREEGFMKSFFSFASDFTRVNAGEKTYSLSNGDGRDVAVFDNNTQTSITKIIPGLLTKILASVDSIKTGRDQEELRYNRDKGTFETVSETKNNLTSGILKDFERSGTKRNLRYITEDLDKMMKANFKFKDSEKEDVREGILRYIYTGKSLHPDTLEENGFYKNFDKKTGLKLKIAIGKYIRQDKTGRNKRYLKDYFERIRTSTPDPMKMMRSHNDSGNMDLLIEEGYVTWDDNNKSYKLVNDTIKDLFSKDSRKDIDEEEKKERTFNSMFEKATYEYIDKAKDKYKENKAKEEQEGKKKSNWSKFWSDVGDKAVDTINKVDEHGISGIKEDFSNLTKETKGFFKDVENLQDLKNKLNELEVIKKGRTRYTYLKEVKANIARLMKESDNPKEFFSKLKETDEYKNLSTELKKELESLYGKANVVKDSIIEDLEDTTTFKKMQEVYVDTKDIGFKAYRIFKEVADPYVKKLLIKIIKTLDSNKVPDKTKIKLINHLVVNLGKLSNSLDNMLLDPIDLDEKSIKDISDLTKDMKKDIARLKKFDVTKKPRLSAPVKLALDHLIRAGKYTSTKKINEILEEAKNIVINNVEKGIDKVNNEFSRSNDNNIKMKFTNFTTNVQEGVSNIGNSIGLKPKLHGPVEPPKKENNNNLPINIDNGFGVKKSLLSRSDIMNLIKSESITKRHDASIIIPKRINGLTLDEFYDYIDSIKFETKLYGDKRETELFKDQLERFADIPEENLKMLCSFKNVVVSSNLIPHLTAAYIPDYNGLEDVLYFNYKDIRTSSNAEILSLIAHEYKHKEQSKSGKLLRSGTLDANSTIKDYYTQITKFGKTDFLSAGTTAPFYNYVDSPWEEEAYMAGNNARYDQLVSEGKIDPEVMSKREYSKSMYMYQKEDIRKDYMTEIKQYKTAFEESGSPWYYDSKGKLLKNKIPKSWFKKEVTNNANIPFKTDNTGFGVKKSKNSKSRVFKDKIIDKDSPSPKLDTHEPISIVKEKPKTMFETVKEKAGSTLNKVKETLSTSREEIFDKISSKAFDKLHSDLEEAGTDSYRKVLVVEFINKMTKILNKLDKIVKDNEKNASLKTKIKTLREKLKDLSETDMSNTDKVTDKVDTIKEELHILADKVLPADEVLEKKSEEFNKKTVKQDEDTFLEILNSDDPVGALKAKVNGKIKSILKKGIVGTYNFGKKVVKADLERGKKLRGYLTDKVSTWYHNRKFGRKGEPGFIRRGLNGGFNLLGALLSGSGKGIKGAALSDLDNGKSMRDFFTNMFKRKPKDEKPKEEKNIHDRDGDGQTDGGWMSILKKRASGLTNKENYTPKALMETAKKPMGIAGIIAMGMMALSAMGVTMKDVASFAKGTWDVLKGVGKVLGGVWDTLKTVGGWIKDSFSWIKNKFSFGSDDKENVKEEIDADKAKISELMKAGKTDTDEYKALVNKVSGNEKKLIELNEEDSTSNASMLGTAAGMGVAGYLGKKVYNVGKAGYDIVKGGVKAVTGAADVVKNVADKVTPDDLSKKKFSNSKIMTTLRSFKTFITKKFKGLAGKKILSNLAKKIAARVVPIAGLAVLAYDIGKITYDVFVNGTELKSAVSKQILGFDLFSDTDVPRDEDGNEIKPDDNLDITDTTSIVKNKDEKLDKRIEEADKNVSTIPKDLSVIKPNENNIVDKEESKEDTPIGTKVSNWFSSLKDKAKSIKDNVVNKVSVGWEKVKGFVSKGIGAVAAYFESGKAGAGTISSGRGDRGGVSYGTHQLSSKTGTLQEYIRGSKYSSEFAGLTPATPAFDAKWKEIFARDPEGFAEDQEAFIAKSHYLPQVKNLSGIGLDLNNRSDALKSAVFSVGVQFGPGSKLINKAIDAKDLDPKTSTDEDLIRSIYGFKKENNDALFKSSSESVRAGTLKRAFKEEDLVLSLLSKEGYKDPVANVQGKVGTEASNNITYTPEAPTTTVDTNTVNTNNNVSSTVASTSPVTTKTEVTPNTSTVSSPVDKTVSSGISNNIAPTSTVPQTVSTVDSSAISAISETNKGLNTINSTLLSSLEVQKQTLEAIKSLSSSLSDKSLNLSKEEKIETPNQKEKFDDKNITQSLGTPNINLSRKKYA